MGLFSRFESKAEDMIEGGMSSGQGGIEPVKLAKRACKEMEREKMVGVGNEYAPTLYNILVSYADDERMNGYYPSLAGEIETYITSQAQDKGLILDCPPLVRFIVDEGLKRGKFDVIAESVSPAIIDELRHEEMVHYGIEASDEPAYDDYGSYGDCNQPTGNAPYNDYGSYDDGFAEPGYDEQPFTGQGLGDQDYGDNVDFDAFEPAAGVEGAAPVAAGVGAAAGDALDAARKYPPTEVPMETVAPQAVAERTMIIDDLPAQHRAMLVNRATGESFTVTGERSAIGRESVCDVVICDPSVSRRHAELVCDEQGWLICDTGSTNGTTVNGNPTAQSRIYSGDVVGLGKTQLEFQEG